LPYRTSWQDLKDLFRPIPGLIRADVMQDREGRSRGCGIVVFETTEDAQEAIGKRYCFMKR
jgi:RNA recognition motif-containing protein